MQVIVDNLLTNYTDVGKGKVILLLHGWGDSMATFQKLQADLHTTYRVLALDLPGFGGSQAPESVWGLDDYSKFVADYLTKLGVKDVYAVVGHSNGGALSIKGVARGDLKPSKLILLAASGIRNKNGVRKLGIKIIAKTGKLLTFWLPIRHKKKLQQKLYGTVGSDMLVVPTLRETFKKTVSQDVQNDAKQLNLPTLLIYARDDRAVPLSDGQIYATLIDGSRLEIINNAEHFVHHDKPEQVAQLIKDFLT